MNILKWIAILLLFSTSVSAQQYPAIGVLDAEGKPMDPDAMQQALSDLQNAPKREPVYQWDYPDYLREIRTAQRELAAVQKFGIRMTDGPLRSSSSVESIPENVRGIPEHLTNVLINSDEDMMALLPAIYEIYGMRNNETLRLRWKSSGKVHTRYMFDEFINGMHAPYQLAVVISQKTKKLRYLNGSLAINRNFDLLHKFNKDEAIAHVLAYLQETRPADSYQLNAENHDARLGYHSWKIGDDFVLKPWWYVEIAYTGKNQQGVAYTSSISKYIDTDGNLRETSMAIP